MQRNWIGRSEGARVKFRWRPASIEVFTTRIDTIYGATFVLLAPEHPLVAARMPTESDDPAAFRAKVARFRGAGSRGARQRRGREGRLLHRPLRHQSVHDGAGAGLGRQLRARRVRHRRRDGRARARSARLRVRPEVRPADPRRRPPGGRRAGRTSQQMTEAGVERRRAGQLRTAGTGCRQTRRGGS